MKFILSFLFAFVFISPVMAAYNPGTSAEICSDINNSDNCKTQVGCGDYDNELGCSQCQSGTYNDGNFSECQPCSSDTDYTVIDNDQTKRHPDGAASCADWVCATGYTQSGDSCYPFDCNFPDGQILRPGATSCDDWFCDMNYYAYGGSCFYCPGNGTTDSGGNTIAAGVGVCSQCSDNNQNIIANIQGSTYYDGYKESPYFCGACGDNTTYDQGTFSCVCNVTYSHQNSLLTCACPTGSNSDGTQCVCDNGRYMNRVSQQCLSCPANAECSNNEVTCDQNTVRTENSDGTVTCATCGVNAGVVSDVCTCDVNAYGNGTNCTKCPAGTFLTTRGTEDSPTAVTGCHMTHETLFCDANGENCMQLIPES